MCADLHFKKLHGQWWVLNDLVSTHMVFLKQFFFSFFFFLVRCTYLIIASKRVCFLGFFLPDVIFHLWLAIRAVVP